MSRTTSNVPLAIKTYNSQMKGEPFWNAKVGAVLGGEKAENLQVKLFNIAELYPGGFKLGTYL